LEKQNVDLVVLDYQMPEMDGIAVARQLRQRKPEVPIVMLSGVVGSIPEHVLCLVDDFVPKGQPASVLLQVVEQFLRRSGKDVASESGDWVATGDVSEPLVSHKRPAARARKSPDDNPALLAFRRTK
jgi:DNA-binding response OmpR family regulator